MLYFQFILKLGMQGRNFVEYTTAKVLESNKNVARKNTGSKWFQRRNLDNNKKLEYFLKIQYFHNQNKLQLRLSKMMPFRRHLPCDREPNFQVDRTIFQMGKICNSNQNQLNIKLKTIKMKSQALRSSRLKANQNRNKKNSSHKLSQSPTLASSYSEKSLWTHSYKNQPFPRQLRRKLWGKKFQFDIYSDQQEQITAVVQQQEEGNQRKITRLPHFKIIADEGQFSSKRSRIRSQVQFRWRYKCKSVQSMKCLPQVLQQKREQDELKKLERSKVCYFKDKNEFNQRKGRSSESHTQIASKVQSVQNSFFPTASRNLPEQIQQNQAQETKSVKLPSQRSIITAEIQKIIVDELDSRRRKQQSKHKQIGQIIEEEKLEQDDQNAKVTRLRLSLDKFETESGYLKQIRDQEVVRKSQSNSDHQSLNQNSQDCHQVPLEREKLQYEDIRQCSSSGKQDDYRCLSKLSVINEQPKQQKNQTF